MINSHGRILFHHRFHRLRAVKFRMWSDARTRVQILVEFPRLYQQVLLNSTDLALKQVGIGGDLLLYVDAVFVAVLEEHVGDFGARLQVDV